MYRNYMPEIGKMRVSECNNLKLRKFTSRTWLPYLNQVSAFTDERKKIKFPESFQNKQNSITGRFILNSFGKSESAFCGRSSYQL